jgi:hypothetical protein
MMLQLAQLASTEHMRKAMNWIWSDAFIPEHREFMRKYPRGSGEYGMLSDCLGLNETIGTLHKHRLINEDLLFDWLAISVVWNRVKGVAIGEREAAGNPALWENFEAMALADEKWSKAHPAAVVTSRTGEHETHQVPAH